MRYDDGMNGLLARPGRLAAFVVSLALIGLVSGGCRRAEEPAPETGGSFDFSVTSDPAMAATLQAGAEATALWLATRTPQATVLAEPSPTPEIVTVEGTPPAGRTGPCPVPEGFILHNREEFCLSAPETWRALNVDGGLAATLRTTPGQAISLQPDWAASTEACHLMIYIAAEPSPEAHLEERYARFVGRTDLVTLTPVQMQSLDGMALLGFTWSTVEGETGGIYAALLGPNRLVHISQGGTLCPLEDLLPVLETLRFNSRQ